MTSRRDRYRSLLEQSLNTIAGTIDTKDPYTRGHSQRVAIYSRELACRLGLSVEEQENIYYIALMHDIGKIGIPDNILNKSDKLTPEEFDIIRTHTAIGASRAHGRYQLSFRSYRYGDSVCRPHYPCCRFLRCNVERPLLP